MNEFDPTSPEEFESRSLDLDVNLMLRAWIYSSDSLDAIAFKIAVTHEFGINAFVFNPRSLTLPKERLERAQQVCRHLYSKTQVALRDQGIYAVHVYRGLRSMQFATGGIQSWTTDFRVATNFDGYDVLEETVDAKRILAFHRGPLWPTVNIVLESEYIVMSQTPR